LSDFGKSSKQEKRFIRLGCVDNTIVSCKSLGIVFDVDIDNNNLFDETRQE
jgi:hypothetical protein